jgi:hypothetical protein
MDSEEENLLGLSRAGGLGLFTAVIFLSGEMAGSGVLSLPKALVGTGFGIHSNKLNLMLFFQREVLKHFTYFSPKKQILS